MRRKVLFIVLASFLLSGIASAASLWGNYKGHPIVRITINGVPVQVTDVPAINFNNRTMIPIYLLKQAGIQYEWDAKNQTVNIIAQSNYNANTPSIPLGTYTIEDAVKELGFPGWEYMTLDAKRLAYQLVEIRKTVSQSEYSVQDALRDLGVSGGSVPTFKTLQMAVSLIQQRAESSSQNVVAPSGELLLYSNDLKVYLGKLTSDVYDPDSIFNEFGDYGSEFSDTSIWNEYGKYGGEFSDESPFNEYATKPPVIVMEGKIIGHLTVNPAFEDAISPYGLKEVLEELGI